MIKPNLKKKEEIKGKIESEPETKNTTSLD